VPHTIADLSDQDDLARLRTLGQFDLGTSLEVIEHLENPIALLRLLRDLVSLTALSW
jgi:2-polyprenyl-3-methyl-5-hydroxy-6-metoxy-1,4-benzoquinol methylase